MSTVEEQLIREERKVLHAYPDHLGYWTIGVGRLIDGRKGGGISEPECDLLLANDIARIETELEERWPWMRALDQARWQCMVLMAFQLGIKGLSEFSLALGALRRGNFDSCAAHMLQSKWAQLDTPQRAHRVATQMRTGKIV
jgi:lysozyme